MQNPENRAQPSRHDLVEETSFEEGADLRDYLRALYYRRWLIVVCTLLALVLGAIQLRKAQPIYAANALIKYDPPDTQLISGMQEAAGSTKIIDEIKTQIEVIQSPKIIRRVIDALGLYSGGAATRQEAPTTPLGRVMAWLNATTEKVGRLLVTFEPEPIDPEVAQRQREERLLRASIEVAPVRDTRVIQIIVYDRRPAQAARIADEFCRQYIDSLIRDKSDAYATAIKWFSQQVGGTRERLAETERKLAEYEVKSNIRVLEQTYAIKSDILKDLSNQIEAQKGEIARYESIGEAAKNDTLLSALTATDPQYASLQKRINELQLQRVSLLTVNTPDHPDVAKIDQELLALNEQIKYALNNQIKEAESNIKVSKLTLDSLQKRLGEEEETVQGIKRELIDFKIIQDEADSTRKLYENLLDQSKLIDARSDFMPSHVSILSTAKIPEEPNSPKVMRTMALFGLLGFAIGVGLVLLVHKLDRSIKEPKVVEARLGLPTLGVVPYLKPSGALKLFGKKKAARTSLVTDYDPKSLEAEAFRVLRTSLQYSSAGRPPKVILVSSCFPQEGKSTVSVNLAISYSQRGDKVLLMDADLKLPTAHKTFDKPRVPGLSDLVTGQQSLDAVIMPSGMPNLDLMPAGPPTPSPGDLLESRLMIEMLDSLRSRYDVIIVDSAPLSGMADTIVLSKAVDGLCIVVNRGKTPLDALTKVVGVLDQVHAHILGVIYNSRTRVVAGQTAGTAYGYGYGYGYGAKAE